MSRPPSVPLPHGTPEKKSCISLPPDPILSGEDPKGSAVRKARGSPPRPVPRHVELHVTRAVSEHRLGPAAVADVPAARALAGRVVLLITQVLSDLLIQRGL